MPKNEFAMNLDATATQIFIGIDGGGTKTNITALNINNDIICSDTFGPTNLLNGTEFEDNLLILLKKLVSNLKKNVTAKYEFYISGGFAGISTKSNSEKRFTNILTRATIGQNITIKIAEFGSDALLALNVYFPDKPGLLLISGTGSICFGKDSKGNIFNTGGFGHMIDDGGSGHWFGKQAVKLALNSKFHHDEKSVIEEMVFNQFDIKEPEELYDLIYKEEGKNLVDSASKLLFDAYKEGCPFAEKAIHKGVDKLEYLVRNCSKLINDEASYVVLHGSVFKQKVVLELLKDKLIDDMNIYKSDKRIDLEAATILLEKTTNNS